MARLLRERQGKVECSASINRSFGPGPAAMPGDDASDVGQSDAGAFKLGHAVKTLKNSEQLLDIGHVESHPIVADEDDDCIVTF